MQRTFLTVMLALVALSHPARAQTSMPIPKEITAIYQISVGSRSMAYICSINPKGPLVRHPSTDRVFVVVNGSKRGPYDDLATLYVDRRPGAFGWLDGGRRVLYVPKIEEKWYVILGDEKFGPYDEVDPFSITVSPSKDVMVYHARIGNEWYVFDGTTRYGPFQAVTGTLWLSEDGSFAYQARADGKWGVYVGARKLSTMARGGTPYWALVDGELVYATTERTGTYVIAGGRKLGPFDLVRDISPSPDGTRFACTYRNDSRWFIVIDSQTVGPFDDVPYFFWLAGGGYGYKVRVGGKDFLFDDDKRWGPYADLWTISHPPGGGPPALVSRTAAQIGWNWNIDVGDARLGTFSDRPFVVWSPDGKTLAYGGKQDGGVFLTVGDRRFGPFQGLRELEWSRDGTGVAYVATDGLDEYVYRGNHRCGPLDGPGDLFWSPSGGALGFTVSAGAKSFRESAVYTGDGCYVGAIGPDGEVVILNKDHIELK